MVTLRFVVIALLVSACDSGSPADSGTPTDAEVGDAAAPGTPVITSVTPMSGSTIGTTRSIAVTFSVPMNASTLVLGGAMGTMAIPTWISSTELRLDPTSLWPESADPGDTKTLVLDARATTDTPIATTTLSYVVDGTPPQFVSVTPLDSALIDRARAIVLVFDRPLSTSIADHVLSGTLLAGQSVAVDGMTLTLTPSGMWAEGSGRTLSVTVRDALGNASAPVALVFHVTDGAVYVEPGGSPTQPGTRDAPKPTIAEGLAAAVASQLDEARVAEGVYGEFVTVPSGVALRGSYDPANWTATPNRTLHTSSIEDPRSGLSGVIATVTLAPDSGLEGFRVISADMITPTCTCVLLEQAATGVQRVIDNQLDTQGCSEANGVRTTDEVAGVEILRNEMDGSTTGTHAAISLALPSGAPNVLISGNQIRVSTASIPGSYGIDIKPNLTSPSAASIRIDDNYIRGGAGAGGSSKSYGVRLMLENATYVIEQNRIYGGTGRVETFGVYTTGANLTTTFHRNAVHGGAPGDTGRSIGVQLTGNARVSNNLITGGGNPAVTSGTSTALVLFTTSARVLNNTLHHGFLNQGYCIRVNTSGTSITNNIIFARGYLTTGASYIGGIYEVNDTSDPVELLFNRFDGFGGAATAPPTYTYIDQASAGTCAGGTHNCYYLAMNLGAAYTTQGAVGTVSGNTIGPAGFEDVDGPDDDLATLFDASGVIENQWWLGSTNDIQEAGIDGTATFGFTDDYDGIMNRTGNGTLGWSIGAYERDL